MKKYYILLEYVLRLLASTWSFVLNKELPQSPCVIAFWHGRMLPVWKLFANKNTSAIVSLNKDGEILAHLLNKWKFQLIRGSSSKKGKEVIQDIMNINEKKYFLITPDGPRGPSQHCKAGAFVIAQKKQIPLYFISCKIKQKKVFNKSWDKFELPMPFSKININISKPINISAESDRNSIDSIMKFCNKNFL